MLVHASAGRKGRGCYLLALFLLSLLVIAFDWHPAALAVPDCPICKAKSSLDHGIAYDVVLDVYTPFIQLFLTQQPFFGTCAVSFSPLSRSPPSLIASLGVPK